jgi:hypothetical protein
MRLGDSFTFNVSEYLYKYGDKGMDNNNLQNLLEAVNLQVGHPSISYYADYRGTSISENASNSFQASKIEGMAKMASDWAREARYILGVKASNESLKAKSGTLTGGALNVAKGAIKGVTDTVGWLAGYNTPGNVSTTLLAGSQFMFPEVWSDSTFSRDYTVAFKFHSPYGDPYSIYKYVYFPLLSLLTLTLPRQQNIIDYTAPFIVRCDVPGYFRINCGVITSLTIKKGGDDNLWTHSGLPMQIDVNVSIKDLYPALMLSKDFEGLNKNIGMVDFLDNMANLGVTEYSLYNSLLTNLKSKVNIFGNLNNWMKNKLRQGIAEENETLQKIGRYLAG